MREVEFARQLEATRARIDRLRQLAGSLERAADVASGASAELRAVLEELHRQHEELATAFKGMAAEHELQRRLGTALRNVDMAIGGSLDPRVVFHIILDEATNQLGVDAASLLLLNPYTQTLEYAARRGFRAAPIASPGLRGGPAGRVLREARIVTIPDLSEAADATVYASLGADEGFAGYCGAPLTFQGEVRGVLELFGRAPLSPDAAWLEFLETLATHAAIAIEKVGLAREAVRFNADLALAYDATVEGWARTLDVRDHEDEGHSQRVADTTVRLARAAGLGDAELAHIRRGALLHDIGKLAISESIVLKPGPLTNIEWEIMRQHPLYGFELLSPIAFLHPALDIPHCHHERWDGSGYPRGLKAEQIPLAARLFAIADEWDVLRAERPYRPAWSKERAREHIRSLAGHHFDPQGVALFLETEA